MHNARRRARAQYDRKCDDVQETAVHENLPSKNKCWICGKDERQMEKGMLRAMTGARATQRTNAP